MSEVDQKKILTQKHVIQFFNDSHSNNMQLMLSIKENHPMLESQLC